MQALERCECEKTAVYELLRTGMVGGPAHVFTRYHEKGITRIRSHESLLTKGAIGYDAIGDVMPCGKDMLVVNKKPFDQKRIAKFSKNVLKGKVLHKSTLKCLTSLIKFSEMSPLFVVQEIPPDRDIPEEMKIYKEKTGRKTVKGTKVLLGVIKAKKILLYTSLIEWYLQHGFRLTTIYQLIEYETGMPFSWFPKKVTNARREVDKDPLKKQLGNVTKLKGNSFYGKMMEDLERQKSTKFTRKEMFVHNLLFLFIYP